MNNYLILRHIRKFTELVYYTSNVPHIFK